MKKHNFNAGPSILPRVAIENAAKAILDFEGSGCRCWKYRTGRKISKP